MILEDNEEYSTGCLTAFRDLTDEQKNIFIKLASDDYSYVFQILFNILDNNLKTLEVIDIFAGERINFPNRKKIYKLLEKIQIYTFVKSRGYSQDSYQLLAKQYKKRISQIKSIVSRIDYLLDNGTFKEIEEDIKEEQDEQ